MRILHQQHGAQVRPQLMLAVMARSKRTTMMTKKRARKIATRGRQRRQLEGFEQADLDGGEEEAGGGAVREEEVDIRSRVWVRQGV